MGLIHYPVEHHMTWWPHLEVTPSMTTVVPSLQVMPKPSHLLAPCSQILQFYQQDYMVNCVKSLFEVKEDSNGVLGHTIPVILSLK